MVYSLEPSTIILAVSFEPGNGYKLSLEITMGSSTSKLRKQLSIKLFVTFFFIQKVII